MDFKYIDKLNEQLKQLRTLQGDKVARAFEIEYTYESNKIEGNTLTLQETSIIIEKGLTVGGKTLAEHLEAINHTHAIDFIKDISKRNEPITERVINEIHALILAGIDNTNAGKYRTVQVMISGAKHTPPPPYEVVHQMAEMMRFYNENKDHLHPIELSAEMHERLVTIHPYIDGNGRTARLLMNLILLQSGYPIAILKGDTESRLRYYNALEVAQVEGDKTPFIDLVATNVGETIQRIINVINGERT
ncbi:Fic family protein [Riemerella anatipestifer]|uniref:Fic family protein n=1 Tax=Riemerella anatipestifer TaxID=34085 RepID=UPI00129EA423|nr:Fic family protein [Riemerella anatipestifer]MRM85974.1 Fic family protein [Riemerella anatipestifer]